MAPIPEHIIDRIRDSLNIVDVISRYVTLKKSGRNFVGLCPFHKEKTPSFSVNPEKQIFHCFGCGVGGNVFTFLMRHENMSFVDAVKTLATETAIELPVTQEFKKQESEQESLFEANRIAQNYFQRQLQANVNRIQDYLQERGIQPQTVKQFKLGMAPDEWEGLMKSLEHFGYSNAPYEKVGLLLKSDKTGKLYDRFRNRLMFPIHDLSGKILGFGGRTLLADEKTPKYINSPESPIYQKSRVLYGLFYAREAIRESGSAVVVEGYMDLIQLHQHGIRNVVATSGTALTEDHARLIRRYTHKIYLCYDADSAGVNAAVRGGEILFQSNLEVNVLILPEGEDPDSYVDQHGKEAFLELLKESEEYFTFRLRILRQGYDLQKAAQRSMAAGEILDALVPMKDNIRVDYYLEKIAEEWQISRNFLLEEFRKKQKASRRRAAYQQPQKTPEPPKKPLVFTGAWGGEKDVILLLLNYFSEIQENVFAHLDESDFLNPEFRELFQLIRTIGKNSPDNLLHHVLEHLDSEQLKSLILREMEHSNREFQKPSLYLQGCIKQIKIARYQASLEIARRKIKVLPLDDPAYRQTLEEMQRAMIELKRWQDVVCRDE